MSALPLPPEERFSLRNLLDLRQPGDAMTAYYALFHPAARTKIWIHRAAGGRVDGFLVRAQTGQDLFRPLVILRGSGSAALLELLSAALPVGREAVFSVPEELGPMLLPFLNVSDQQTLSLLRLNPSRFQPVVNIFVRRGVSPDGLPRFEIRQGETLVASAGVNWRSPDWAEIFVQTIAAAQERGYGKSVCAALCEELVGAGRSVLYAVSPENRPSLALAASVGFEDTAQRELVCTGSRLRRADEDSTGEPAPKGEGIMIEAAFHFPAGFRWGTATAAHQVEGMNRGNDWWAWEQQPGRIKLGQKSGAACGWWDGRWREDLDRAAAGGQNAHRMSVEWSRIEPEPGRWDCDALDRYREILSGMRQRGIEPLITLHHFSNPLWLAELGGWEDERVVGRFESFVRRTVGALADLADFWVTINEPNVYAFLGYASHEFPPGKNDSLSMFRVMRNQVLAHAAAYHAIHNLQPRARVGIAPQYRAMVPHSRSPLDRLARNIQARIFNDLIPLTLTDGRLRLPLGRDRIRAAAGTLDFIGLNYYSQDDVSFDLRQPGGLFGRRYYPAGADLSPIGMNANIPAGLDQALRWAGRFHLPISITENGIEDADDVIRPRYMAEHIHRMWKAVNVGVPIRGYYHWTLVDNFEWERGWTQRFGLWALDPETQVRTERKSGMFYDEICRENGVSSEMVRRYAPEVFAKLFPG